jgi:hypothetical protein
MRKLQMFKAMIAAVVLCIAGTGAADAACTIQSPMAYNPASFVFDAAKPSVTQYEYKFSFLPVGCNTNYSVEVRLWSHDVRSNGLAVLLPDKSQIGGHFSTLNPTNSVPVTAILDNAIKTASPLSQTVKADGSAGTISIYYNVDLGTNTSGLFKPGKYTAPVNVAVYIRNNATGEVVPAGVDFIMNLYVDVQPAAWLDHYNDKLDFGELAYGGLSTESVYVYAYTNVKYALTFHSENGFLLKTSPKDTVGVGYEVDFSPVNWDPRSANGDPRDYFNTDGKTIGLQGPTLTGKINTDPSKLPAGTYSDTLTISLDTLP